MEVEHCCVGWSSSTSSIAASPLVAVPTTESSRWCSISARRCSRNASSSSASKTRIAPSEVSALKSSHLIGSGGLGQGRTIALMLGILYDIHGNLPALERVLDEAGALDIDRWLLGGDYGTPSPWPEETLARLKELPNATWIRGNGERWLREPPEDRPEVMETYDLFRGSFDEELVDWLYALPPQTELDGVLYVHGSPLSDVESFHPTREDDDEKLLDGVRDRTIVFGHSHQQFRRPGPNDTDLVNPGSVGMPLDGDVRAAWATWDGDFEFRRTEYDVAESRGGLPLDGRRLRRVRG